MKVILVFYLFCLLHLSFSQWIEKHDLDLDKFSDENKNLSQNGYSLATLCGYSSGNDTKYHALWEKDKVRGPLIIKPFMTLQEFKQEAEPKYMSESSPFIYYSLAYACGFERSGVTYYSAIWEKRPTNFYKLKIHINSETLQNHINEFRTGRLQMRLFLLNAYKYNSTDYYVAAWEHTSSVQDWQAHHRVNKNELNSLVKEYESKNYRIKSISGYEYQNNTNYAVIWEKIALIDPLPLKQNYGMVSLCYEDELESKKEEGFRPRFINAFISGSNVEFNVIWEKHLDDQNGIKEIDDAVMSYLNNYMGVGLSLAITKDEKLVYNKAYGRVDSSINEPLSVKNSMKIGSISKTFTSLAILKLHQDGHLKSLDKKVFGPDSIFGNKYYIPSYNYDNLTQVTVRQLLSHRSGMAGHTDSEWYDFYFNPSLTSHDFVNYYLKKKDLFNKPVNKNLFEYSNHGYIMLGLIIEEISGQPVDCYIKSNVLNPLGIGSSMFVGSVDGFSKAPRESFYTPGSRLNSVSALATGGWVSSSQDLAKMLTGIDGSPFRNDLVKSELLKEMTSSYGDDVSSYGLGLITKYLNRTGHGHSGSVPNAIFSDSYIYKNGLTITILPNFDIIFYPKNTEDSSVFKSIFETVADAVDRVKNWPNQDLFVKLK